jgi:hypothetical protein
MGLCRRWWGVAVVSGGRLASTVTSNIKLGLKFGEGLWLVTIEEVVGAAAAR